MNICFLEGDMSRKGGTERMTAILANELSDSHTITIVSLCMKNQNIFFELKDKINHVVLSNSESKAGIVKQAKKIRKYIISQKIDCIINVDVGMGIYGILAARSLKVRVITWEHSNYFNNWNSRFFPLFRRIAAKYSDAMVVLTNQDKKNYLENINGIRNINVIANPVELHSVNYSTGAKIILSAGLLTPIKGFDKAILVAKKVFERHPDWKWIICGDGPERKKLQEMIDQEKLQDNFILAGTVSNMQEQYKKAAIYVMTSEMEGLPMVLLEAKSWGLPIVSFDIMTGPRDIVSDGLNGYLVKKNDIDAMSEKINTLIENENLRYEFSKNAKIEIENYKMDSIREQWEKLFEEMSV